MEPFRLLAAINRAENPPVHQTDEILLGGLGSADAALSLAFVRRFRRVVFGVAVSILRDPAAAEGVALDTFQHAARNGPMYDARCGSVRGWLCAIARDLAVGALPPPATIPSAPPDDLPALLTALTGTDKESAQACDSSAGSLRGALAALPAAEARAVLMTGVYGMRPELVAEAEGTAIVTTRNQVRAGLGKLQSAQLRLNGY
jgi:RNA polymerase sigma-70 factor (ECF subfamily)